MKKTKLYYMKLTKEWQPYDGDYQKKMQDIKLKNGDVVTMCWPNAGYWNICEKEGNEKYYGKDIHHNDAAYVRITHNNDWG
jgi:hypothetical protein